MYLIITEEGNTYIINSPGRYVYNEGKIEVSEDDLKSLPKYKTTSQGKKVVITKPYYTDLFDKVFKRGAQIIHEKDLGYLMRKFFLKKDMVILEAGSGSGHATVFLSFLAKKIISYEKDKRFYDITRQNLDLFNVKNVELIFGDIIENTLTEHFDLVLFDFKDSIHERYLKKAYDTLKPGGYVVLYLPVIEQLSIGIKNLEKLGFIEISVREILLRDWKIKPLRPKNEMLSHTAFMLSARKF